MIYDKEINTLRIFFVVLCIVILILWILYIYFAVKTFRKRNNKFVDKKDKYKIDNKKVKKYNTLYAVFYISGIVLLFLSIGGVLQFIKYDNKYYYNNIDINERIDRVMKRFFFSIKNNESSSEEPGEKIDQYIDIDENKIILKNKLIYYIERIPELYEKEKKKIIDDIEKNYTKIVDYIKNNYTLSSHFNVRENVDMYMIERGYELSPYKNRITDNKKENKKKEIADFVKYFERNDIREILDPDNKKVNINDYIMYNYIKKNN